MAKKVTLNPKPKTQNSTTGVGGRPKDRNTKPKGK